MNQQEVLQKIKELAAQIEKSSAPTNTLEIAVLKSKCVELYEHIQILVPQYHVPAEPVMHTTTVPAEEMRPLIEEQDPFRNRTQEVTPPAEVKPVEETSLFAKELLAEAFKEAAEPVVREEDVLEPMAEINTLTIIDNDEPSIYAPLEPIAPVAPTAPVVETPVAPVIERHVEQPILQDIFARHEGEQSIHERLSKSSPKNDINDRLQSKVESLKAAISLNKKIAFVNQLFNENTVEYAKAIDKLNAATTLDEAMLFFAELKHTYTWTNENELVKELQGLVEKRFGQ